MTQSQRLITSSGTSIFTMTFGKPHSMNTTAIYTVMIGLLYKATPMVASIDYKSC